MTVAAPARITTGPGPVVTAPAAGVGVLDRPVTDSIETGPVVVPADVLHASQGTADQLRAQTLAGDDPTTRPSFLHKALEVIQFIFSCLPVVGQIIHALSLIVILARLIFAVVSGEHKEQINWTAELARIGAHLAGLAVPMLGAFGSAAANYWFDVSENRQGVQLLGGINYYLGDDEFGRNRRGVVREVIDGTRRMVSGAFTPTPTQPVAVGPTAVVDPALQPPVDPALVRSGPTPQGRTVAPGAVFAPRAERAIPVS